MGRPRAARIALSVSLVKYFDSTYACACFLSIVLLRFDLLKTVIFGTQSSSSTWICMLVSGRPWPSKLTGTRRTSSQPRRIGTPCCS